MAAEKDVARLKKELEEMAAEFREFRAKVKAGGKKRPAGDVKGQTVEPCDSFLGCFCVAWTRI